MWWISVESINKRCRYGAIIPKFGQIHPRVFQYDLLIFEHVVQAVDLYLFAIYVAHGRIGYVTLHSE